MIKISLIRPGIIEISFFVSAEKSLKILKFDAISILTNYSEFLLLGHHI